MGGAQRERRRFSRRGAEAQRGDSVDQPWSRGRRRFVVQFPSLRPCASAGGLSQWVNTSAGISAPPHPPRDFSWFGGGAQRNRGMGID
jgi:hypothetical protein